MRVCRDAGCPIGMATALHLASRRRAARGSGSIGERSPGVFEVRVVVGRDPATGLSVQRSFTVRGDASHAEARRRELVADFGIDLRCCTHRG